MALFPNWGNLGRLDIVANTTEITFFRDNQPMLTAEKGVSLGLLKLIYSSESNNSYGNLLGVKPRDGVLQRIITSDATILDKDEYDMIIQEQFVPPIASGFLTLPAQKQNFNPEQQLLTQPNVAFNNHQPLLPAVPSNVLPQPTAQFFTQFLPNILQQTFQSFSPFNQPVPKPVAPLPEPIPEPLNLLASPASVVQANIQPTSSVATVFSNEKSTENAEADVDIANKLSTSQSALLAEKDVTALAEELVEQDDTVTEGNYIDTAKFPFQCEVCHIPFKSKSKFKHHQRRHTEEKPYLCTYCGDSFKHFFELSKHRDELHLCNKSFKCDQCPKSFSTRKELNHHMWRHTGEKMHKCDLCGKQYSSAGNLRLHKQKHKGSKPFKCPLCPKTFFHKSVLENHIRSGHTGERPFVCRFCDKAFPNNSQLSSHLKRHSDSRPHTCKICGKGFRQSHILKRHSILHTSERPYKCHLCPKTFRESGNLQYHMSTHQSKADRLVLCPFCDKAIVAGRGVRRHLKIHHSDECPTEEDIERLAKSLKPDREKTESHLRDKEKKKQGNLPCPECEKKCKSITGLKKHFTMEHPDKKLTEAEIKDLQESVCNPDPDSHECQFCQRFFRSQQRLNNHMLIMHPDQVDASEILQIVNLEQRNKQKRKKNNVCGKCGKTFFMQATLKSHLEKEHKVSKEICQSKNDGINRISRSESISERIDPDGVDRSDGTINRNSQSESVSDQIGLGEMHRSDDTINRISQSESVSDQINCSDYKIDRISQSESVSEQIDHSDYKIDPISQSESVSNQIDPDGGQCFDSLENEVEAMDLVLSDDLAGFSDTAGLECNPSSTVDITLIEKALCNDADLNFGEKISNMEVDRNLCVDKDALQKEGRKEANDLITEWNDRKEKETSSAKRKNIRTKRPPVSCSLCQREFSSVKRLANHMALSHKEYRTILIDGNSNSSRKKCKFCVMSFAYSTTLERHVEKVHAHFLERSNGKEELPEFSRDVERGSGIGDGGMIALDKEKRGVKTRGRRRTVRVKEKKVEKKNDEGLNDMTSDKVSCAELQSKNQDQTPKSDESRQKSSSSTSSPDKTYCQNRMGFSDSVTDSQLNGCEVDPKRQTRESKEMKNLQKQASGADDTMSSSSSRPTNVSSTKDSSFEIISSTTENINDDETLIISRTVDNELVADVGFASEKNPDKPTEMTEIMNIEKNETELDFPVIKASDFLKLQTDDWQRMTVNAEKFPFVAPNSVLSPPPLGYSYAYLPVLVPDTERASGKENT